LSQQAYTSKSSSHNMCVQSHNLTADVGMCTTTETHKYHNERPYLTNAFSIHRCQIDIVDIFMQFMCLYATVTQFV